MHRCPAHAWVCRMVWREGWKESPGGQVDMLFSLAIRSWGGGSVGTRVCHHSVRMSDRTLGQSVSERHHPKRQAESDGEDAQHYPLTHGQTGTYIGTKVKELL